MRLRYVAICILLLTLIPHHARAGSRTSVHPAVEGQVVQVLSGDSIALKVGQRLEKVHYIGVRTPQLEKGVEAASNSARKAFLYNTQLVKGKTLHLEFDVQQRDPSGWLLAYVFLLNGTFINSELLLNGYAEAVYTPPNGMYRNLFVRLENQARSIGLGMWRLSGASPLTRDGGAGPFLANRLYKIFHRPDCRWVQGMPAAESASFPSREEALSQGYLPCLHCKP